MTEEAVPRLLAQAWGVAVAPQRGPKRELTHEAIVESAMSIADDEGLDAVTMARVAKSFGFTTMALYRYVTSKQDLHQLMADAVLSQSDWLVDETDWSDALHAWARKLHDAYASHQWALQIPPLPESHLMPGRMQAAAGVKESVLTMVTALVKGLTPASSAQSEQWRPTQETVDLLQEVVANAHLVDLEPLVRGGAWLNRGAVEDGGPADATGLGPLATDPSALQAALDLVVAGLNQDHATVEPAAPEIPRTPQAEWDVAEAELARITALRKRAQRTLKDLEKREARVRTARERAKTAAKEAAKAQKRS
jgi:AcrR family transcriptional regulator